MERLPLGWRRTAENERREYLHACAVLQQIVAGFSVGANLINIDFILV
jgi:hypothetical protein